MTDTVLQTQHVLPMWKRQAYIWSVMVLGVLPCTVLLPLNTLFTIMVLSELNLFLSKDLIRMMISIIGFLGNFAIFNAICDITEEKIVSRRTVIFGFLGVIAAVFLIVGLNYDRLWNPSEALLSFGMCGAPIIAYFITLHYNYMLKKYAKVIPLERIKELSVSAG